MKQRYQYPLMYAVPTLFFSAIFMVVVTVAIAGVLWIFVYGDNAWPSFVSRYSPIFMADVLALVWLTLLSVAHLGQAPRITRIFQHEACLLFGWVYCGFGASGVPL